MTTTYDSAYTSITTAFQTWMAANELGVGTINERYYGIEKGTVFSGWTVRFQMQPVLSGQSSFRQTDGKRYRNTGSIVIEVYAPRGKLTAYSNMRKLSQYVQKLFRSAIDCVSFVNVRINDVDATDSFLRQNVVATYRFDEIQ